MVRTGIENTGEWMDFLKGKRVGLITNPTGVGSGLRSTIDILKEKTALVRLFSPEHGVRGDIQAGDMVNYYVDEKTSLPVFSLYGKNKKPSEEMLKDIDVLAFDIQDVGSRLYTYLYTMSYCMQSCGEYKKTFLVFDRPNPVGGVKVEGNLVKPGFTSFVGLHPIPYRYGLTIGEAALLFNQEFHISCDLKVIPMTGWERTMYYEDTGLPWIMPSPNMPAVDTAVAYNSTCILEGTNISEGRGTTKPFELAGAPWLEAETLAINMNKKGLSGVLFRPVYFTPTFSKHVGILCRGVQLHVTDRESFCGVKTGLYLLEEIKNLSGDKFSYNAPYSSSGKPMIDYNTGDDFIRTHDFSAKEVYEMWAVEAEEFAKKKEKYHLY
ncbi:Uncharacterized conserved protein YbbC, DUF1343 family [Anaerocolumna jejuensis DSM 15929]|uniref:Uncharacterized conserved protein YbbC, DUF1343 family n=1 Tax=Anaerocolumna jejuensis DSM 15929 TaxID=1121322 RepID=A0A1M7ANR8_9FIRM|nr:DUF1343 domain-containing protein [Anaerocolumna jejuensis]SHL44196.1 Uncharacterized conserved protein YbbC, DUF1343 family [Anaerocolumna jejuensis DSM 15929]